MNKNKGILPNPNVHKSILQNQTMPLLHELHGREKYRENNNKFINKKMMGRRVKKIRGRITVKCEK